LNDNIPYKWEDKTAMLQANKDPKMSDDNLKIHKKMICSDVNFRKNDADVTKMIGAEAPQ